MGVLLVVFAASMAAATFIENDYGSSAAYNFVYDTRWFELILLLLTINLIGQIFVLKLYKRSKLTIMLFHLAFVVMIAGAAITRYTGWEGTIHIREGEQQNVCFSSEKYLGYLLRDESGKQLSSGSEEYYMSTKSAENYRKKIRTGNKEYELVLSKILPNASEVISDSPAGVPLVSLLVVQNMGRETVILKKGEIKESAGISLGLDADRETDVIIKSDSATFHMISKFPFEQMSMMTQETGKIEPGQSVELKPMQIITINGIKLVPQQMSVRGELKPGTLDMTVQETGRNAFIFNLYEGNKITATIYLWDSQSEKSSTDSVSVDGNTLKISYGSKPTTLPFSIKLNDFVMERYPGSNSPSGYKSDVVLLDKAANVEKPFLIFMNNILKYKGYRFYQSSYDPDELGTVLSVNHDFAGMIVTYTGYALLFLFIILSLLNRRSAFNSVTPGYWNSPLRKIIPTVLVLLVLSGFGTINAQKLIPDRKAAEEFGKVLVQDQKGRTKPLFTMSNDILRKVTRENKFDGMTSMQVFLGIYLDFNNWKDVPLIKVSNKDLQQKLGIRGDLAAFTDIVNFEQGGSYKLSDDINKVYAKSPGQRTKLDKEVMKVDERVNIIYMIYTGGFTRLFPLRDGSHAWGTPQEALKTAEGKEDSLYLQNIVPMFAEALQTNNAATAKQISESVTSYQKRFAGYDLPPKSKTGAEILYYKMMIFEKLFPFYATIGLVMLISLIVMVIRGKNRNSLLIKILGWLLFAAFLFHTFGLGLRWFISGHSPMSNGYESMIFISWVTLLAGFIFSRKSVFALSATAVLAGMTLMVAHLSFMDPEITNLVPVLKSYWLTMHVSVITGSYGFLGLGAILGIITMILLSLSNDKNRERISNTIDELSVINLKTLILGLYFLTIGTFLGAVWANESWGRYWGWDPKETWSLITIIIYSIVTHSRLIPGMKDIYTFNLLSLFAFSSVLMTYFGVNYYLSGLHSYAAGEAARVPAFVYIALIVIAGLSLMAYVKYKKWEKLAVKK